MWRAFTQSADLTLTANDYIGRFAPSPSGPLHLGSLACALASYLDAKANHGRWLVRIEDIDPPREQPGADILILSTLQAHGLVPDDEVRYQSKRSFAYKAVLKDLQQRHLSYLCNCTRKRLSTLRNYDRHCLNSPPTNKSMCATRVNVHAANAEGAIGEVAYTDLIQGPFKENINASGDFIIRRKDGLFAYQLAVSIDDADQQISHVVRGSDLLETTAKQRWLIDLMAATSPKYAHIPVICTEPGHKLSKQNHAEAIKNDDAARNIQLACRALGLSNPPTTNNAEELLNWGLERWSLTPMLGKREVMLGSLI